MRPKTNRQYTLRNIPDSVDEALRQRARETGKSFNQVAVEALIIGSGGNPKPKRDFGPIFGCISPEEAAFLEAEVKAQRQIDLGLWR